MKLQELLRLPVYRETRVLAGVGGLNRPVKSVNMMDAPDIIDYLKADELLLTTGYALRDQPGELLQLVRQMAGTGCAGLAIKTKRFLKEIPTSVLKLADELDFPLIELALSPSLGELLQESLNFILEKHNDELRYALRMHRDFSALIMKGEGQEAIIEALSDLVGGAVMLVDWRGNRIGGLADRVSISVDSIRVKEQLQTAAASMRNFASKTVEFCLLPGGDETHEACCEVIMQAIELPYQSAFLTVVNGVFGDSPLPRLALEQAANVIGLELVKQQALQERLRRYKDEFFEEWMNGVFQSRQEILSLGKRYGLREADGYLCVAGKVDESGRGETAGRHAYQQRDRLYELLEAKLAEFELPALLFNNKEMLAVVIQREASSTEGVGNEYPLLPCLVAFQEQLQREEQLTFSFGIGNQTEQITGLPNAYKEAISALHMGQQARQTSFIHFYRAREVLELLKMVPEVALTDFYQETFQAIMRIDARERTDLMDTARVYLETQGQIGETAKRLFVHRNTVAYRLEKFEHLTRCHLRDPDDSLRLRLAFLAEKLL